MMKAILIFVFVALAVAKTKWFELDDYSFEKYEVEYRKFYKSPEERAIRSELFQRRFIEAVKHNQDPSQTYKKGINHMSDWTNEELQSLLGHRKDVHNSLRQKEFSGRIFSTFSEPISALPSSVDWRTKGVVSPVKDQGQCGSCWSFGSAETIESQYAIAMGTIMEFSEQQILDCTVNPNHCGGTGGCEGGTNELAFQTIINAGGIATEWTYPYISYGGNNEQCHFNPNWAFGKVKSYVVLPSNQYEPVMTAVAQVGPLAITVDASSWFAYESGVYNGCNQTDPDLDHSVQLVGYGTDTSAGDYWIVRNSWSTQWGEDGYIRIARTSNVQCGTDTNPSDGTGCDNGPPQVTVCGTCGILYDVSYPVMA